MASVTMPRWWVANFSCAGGDPTKPLSAFTCKADPVQEPAAWQRLGDPFDPAQVDPVPTSAPCG
jgi:hypothetical protein